MEVWHWGTVGRGWVELVDVADDGGLFSYLVREGTLYSLFGTLTYDTDIF